MLVPAMLPTARALCVYPDRQFWRACSKGDHCEADHGRRHAQKPRECATATHEHLGANDKRSKAGIQKPKEGRSSEVIFELAI